MHMKKSPTPAILAAIPLSMLLAGASAAQSTGASPADPNNERNQRMAPSNTQPSDPAADTEPGDRVPTAPVDLEAAEREGGAASGATTGEMSPSAYPESTFR